jgi:hypothetical protein
MGLQKKKAGKRKAAWINNKEENEEEYCRGDELAVPSIRKTVQKNLAFTVLWIVVLCAHNLYPSAAHSWIVVLETWLLVAELPAALYPTA